MPEDGKTNVAPTSVELNFDGKSVNLPVVEGSEGERGIDIGRLRSETGLITIDPGFVNTGSCESRITFIDGEQGILRSAATRSRSSRSSRPSSRSPGCSCSTASCRPRTSWSQLRRDEITDAHHASRGRRSGFISAFMPKDAHPMAGLRRRAMGALSTYYREANTRPERTRTRPGCRWTGCWRSCPRSRRTRTSTRSASRSDVSAQRPRLPRRNFMQLMYSPTPCEEYEIGPGRTREGARPAADPARGPRAELLDQHRPPRRQRRRSSLFASDLGRHHPRSGARSTAAPTRR